MTPLPNTSVQSRTLAEGLAVAAAGLRRPSRAPSRPVGQWLALRFFANPASLTPTAASFAEQHHVTPATAKPTMGRLTADGLLAVQSDVMDLRARRLSLTERGAEIYATDPLRSLTNAVANDIDAAQLEAFIRVIRILVLAGAGAQEHRIKSFAYPRRRLRIARIAAAQQCGNPLFDAFCALAAIAPVMRHARSTHEGSSQAYSALRYFSSAPADAQAITAFAECHALTQQAASSIVRELRRRSYLVKVDGKREYSLTDLGRRVLMRDPIQRIAAPVERSLTPEQIALAGQALDSYLARNAERHGRLSVRRGK